MATVAGLAASLYSCQHTPESEAVRPASAAANASAADYLVFSSSAAFEETQNALDDLAPGESVNGHLAEWEEQQNFYSLRRYYEELEQQGDTVSVRPVTDTYFAAVLSPKGVIQIGSNIFKLHFGQDRITYIPAEQKAELYDDLLADADNPDIRYFYTDENVFDVLASGDAGTPTGTVRVLDQQRGCPAGAKEDQDDDPIFYSNKQRLKCIADYQKFGIYFLITGKARNQKRTLGIYWAQAACLYTVPNPGASWEERCPPAMFFGSYTNSDTNNCGVGPSNDNNEVLARPYHSVHGLRTYVYDVKFNVGGTSGFTTRNFHVDG